jgi:hypothetical protein
MRYQEGLTHLEMGRRLSDHEHLKQAEAIFADIGAEFDLAKARTLLQRMAERKATESIGRMAPYCVPDHQRG